DDVIGVARRRLNFAAEQQSVLVGDEESAVIGNGRPADALHERIVERHSLDRTLFAELREFPGRNLAAIILFEGRNPLVRRDRMAGQSKAAVGEASEGQANQAADDSLLEAVA